MNALPTRDDIAAAQAVLLRHPDMLADWLAAQCLGTAQVRGLLKLGEKATERFVTWPVAWLLVVCMDQAQSLATRCAAMNAIAQRFLAEDDIQAEVISVANRLVGYDAEAAEQDAREARRQFADLMDAPALALVWSA